MRGLAVLAALLLVGAAPAPGLPSIAARGLDGAPVAISAAHRRVVVVHYWASWCAPCRAEMPWLDAAYARYHARGLDMVGIALDSGASRDKLLRSANSVRFPLVRLADTRLPVREVPAALPETRIYDREGHLAARFSMNGRMMAPGDLDAVLPGLLGPGS